MTFQFNPPTGLMDTSVYPAKPASETAARQQFMDLFNQIGVELNAQKVENANNLISSFVKRLQNGEVTKIKLIGDSITEGYGATGHVQTLVNTNNGKPIIFNDGAGTVWYESLYTDPSWANFFRSWMTTNFPSVNFVNAGIGGKDTTWALANKQYWIGTEDVVFVMLGANDRWNVNAATYKANMISFLAYVKAHCNQLIVLTTPPSRADFDANGNAISFATNTIDRILTEICVENGYSHISFYREMMNFSAMVGIDVLQFIYDDTHPGNLGHNTMWKILQKNIGVSDDYIQKANDYLYRTGTDKQFLIDSNFQIAQMKPVVGTVVNNPAAYTYPIFDMWKAAWFLGSGDSFPNIKHSQRKITDSGAALGSVPGAKYCYRINVDAAGSVANSGYDLVQTVENGVSNYCISNGEIIVTLYARSTIPNKQLGVNLELGYGSGGAPTSNEFVICPTKVTLSTSWKKYVFIVKCPDFSSKVFGTNNDDTLILHITIAGGAVAFGGSGDIEIAQVCAGSHFTKPFQKTFAEELKACQRYLEKNCSYGVTPDTNGLYDENESVNNVQSTFLMANGLIKYLQEKRTKPTVKIYSFDAVPDTVRDMTSSTTLAAANVSVTSRYRGFEISSPNNSFVVGHQYLLKWFADCRW